jgi:murein L,D-transpeptidase YcbB/YkuD
MGNSSSITVQDVMTLQLQAQTFQRASAKADERASKRKKELQQAITQQHSKEKLAVLATQHLQATQQAAALLKRAGQLRQAAEMADTHRELSNQSDAATSKGLTRLISIMKRGETTTYLSQLDTALDSLLGLPAPDATTTSTESITALIAQLTPEQEKTETDPQATFKAKFPQLYPTEEKPTPPRQPEPVKDELQEGMKRIGVESETSEEALEARIRALQKHSSVGDVWVRAGGRPGRPPHQPVRC